MKDGLLPNGTTSTTFPADVTLGALDKAVRVRFAAAGAITALLGVSLAEASRFGWIEMMCTDAAASTFLADGRIDLDELGSWAVVAQPSRGTSSEADSDCRVTIDRGFFDGFEANGEEELPSGAAKWLRRDVMLRSFQRELRALGIRVFFAQPLRSMAVPPLTTTAYPLAGPKEMAALLMVMQGLARPDLALEFCVERNPVAVAMESARDGAEVTAMAEPAMIEGHADGDLMVTPEEVREQVLANKVILDAYAEAFKRPHLISSFVEHNIFGRSSVVLVLPGHEVDMYTLMRTLDTCAFEAKACNGAQTLKWGFHFRDKCGGRTRMNGPSWYGRVSADKSLRGQPGTANWMRSPNWDPAGSTMKKLADELIADGKMRPDGEPIRTEATAVASFATMLTPRPKLSRQGWGSTGGDSKRSRRRRQQREESSSSDSSGLGSSGKPRKKLSSAFGHAGDGGDGEDEVPFDAAGALSSAMAASSSATAVTPHVSGRDKALLSSMMGGLASVLAPLKQQLDMVQERQSREADSQKALATRLGQIDDKLTEQSRRMEEQAEKDKEHQERLATLRQKQLERLEQEEKDEEAFQAAVKSKREAKLRSLEVVSSPRQSRRRKSRSPHADTTSDSDSELSDGSARAARRLKRAGGQGGKGLRSRSSDGRKSDLRGRNTDDKERREGRGVHYAKGGQRDKQGKNDKRDSSAEAPNSRK